MGYEFGLFSASLLARTSLLPARDRRQKAAAFAGYWAGDVAGERGDR